MHAVTFQAPGEVRVEERPDPELQAPDDAIVRIEATGVCGSDLHIFHGRVAIEPGFTIGHEYVGTVRRGRRRRAVASPSAIACWAASWSPAAPCPPCRAGNYHKCDHSRVFGHGAALGALQGTQAELALVPRANLTLRRVPDGMPERRRAVRRRRHGHRLPRGRAGARRATASSSSGSGRSACAPCRRRVPRAPRRSSPIDAVAGAPGDGAQLRRDAGPPDRGGPARGGEGRHRRARRRRRHRGRRRPARAWSWPSAWPPTARR